MDASLKDKLIILLENVDTLAMLNLQHKKLTFHMNYNNELVCDQGGIDGEAVILDIFILHEHLHDVLQITYTRCNVEEDYQ